MPDALTSLLHLHFFHPLLKIYLDVVFNIILMLFSREKAPSSPMAEDDDLAKKLWEHSERLVAVYAQPL